MKSDQSVCPRYRNLRCVAGERCSFDEKQGCKVCECEKIDSEPPSLVQPDDEAAAPGTP